MSLAPAGGSDLRCHATHTPNTNTNTASQLLAYPLHGRKVCRRHLGGLANAVGEEGCIISRSCHAPCRDSYHKSAGAEGACAWAGVWHGVKVAELRLVGVCLLGQEMTVRQAA